MPDHEPVDTIVIGGGPAGLRAAEVLAAAGQRVALYDQKPSVGRKFLVAGKGGLNLTHSEPLTAFIARYEDEPMRWRGLLEGFGPAELRTWAQDLGVETYVGTSGRVFPRGQQAAVLLRGWVARLRALGVVFHVAHRLESLRVDADQCWRLTLRHTRTGETARAAARVVVLALGGASWPKTGSDGTWPEILRPLGLPVAPWQPANCGFEVAWDPRVLAAAEGLPIKNITASAEGRTIAGELLITRYGLEGGALYQLGRPLRAMGAPALQIDFKPGVSEERLDNQLPPRFRQPVDWQQVARCWRLGKAAAALLEFYGPATGSHGRSLATSAKQFFLPLQGPRPVAEAISSAGGIAWSALNDDLMLTAHPGLFAAGEMIDWEAPTGGYLLQGCFATGTRAGVGARRFLERQPW